MLAVRMYSNYKFNENNIVMLTYKTEIDILHDSQIKDTFCLTHKCKQNLVNRKHVKKIVCNGIMYIRMIQK